jgi:hypothetical protein
MYTCGMQSAVIKSKDRMIAAVMDRCGGQPFQTGEVVGSEISTNLHFPPLREQSLETTCCLSLPANIVARADQRRLSH